MKTIHEIMKHINTAGLIVATLLMTAGMASCSSDTMEEVRQASTPSEDDEVVKLLRTVPGVSQINKKTAKDGAVFYFFKFTQHATHAPSSLYKATFEQHAYLRFVSLDAPVVLHTQGYHTHELEEIGDIDLAKYLNANVIELEHRYFGASSPEPNTSLEFTYFYAEEAAYDLHELVTAFKQSLFTSNKWVATGASKSGINSALYAFYSSKYGWKDIDLFVPFCAPFLTGTADSPCDTSVGEYLVKSSGSGYPEGSAEAIARKRINALPKVIADNASVREKVISAFKSDYPSDYAILMNNCSAGGKNTTGNLEKDVTAYIMSYYYDFLLQKFAYLKFSSWAPYVPDPEKVATDRQELQTLLAFTLMDNDKYVEFLNKLIQSQQSGTKAARRAYNDAELLNYIQDDETSPYQIQAVMELGFNKFVFTDLQGCSFITPEDADKLSNLFLSPEMFNGNEAGYHNYVERWDHGIMMTDFREWVNTQTTTPMIFVYGTNDPWTGGKIDDPATSMVKVIMNKGGFHSQSILNKEQYTPEATQAIKDAIKQFIGL